MTRDNRCILGEFNCVDPEFIQQPYGFYEALRETAPVWKCPVTNFYVVTRYDDICTVLRQPNIFCNDFQRNRDVDLDKERSKKVREQYERNGWLPAPALSGRDGEDHKPLRKLFQNYLTEKRLRSIEPRIERLAHEYVSGAAERGSFDCVSEISVPFPLQVICELLGMDREHMPQIKTWTDAWIRRFGMTLSESEELELVDMEIEAQHFFHRYFEKLRKRPDDTLLSALVNSEVPEWGRRLTDEELMAEVMADTFVGGSETTSNALSAGVLLLCKDSSILTRLSEKPESMIPPFVEEVLRLEAPLQGFYRITTQDTEVAGFSIPEGSVVNVRYGSANRDSGQFEQPNEVDLTRKNAATHLTFGKGVHSCVGASLARKELYWAFRAMVMDWEEVILSEKDFAPAYHHNIAIRAIVSLPVQVRRAG